MTRRPARWIAVLLAIAVLAAACGGDDRTDEGAADDARTDEGAADEGTATTTTVSPSSTSTATAPTSSTTTSAAPAAPEPASGCGRVLDPGTVEVSFEFEDRSRSYVLHVPAGYDANTPTPVVLNWHGLGSDGPQQLGFSEYAPVADREGFLVVAPTGVPTPGDTRNSWEIVDEQDPTRDDLAFANRVLDLVIEGACIDQTRVYTTGMSNGGYFSSRLVCEMGHRIAAAASVAGLTHEDDCDPVRPVPYLAFHGVDDEIVPYGGGESSLAPGAAIELFERSIPDEFAEFAADFGCDPEPVAEEVTAEVTRFVYPGCADGVDAVFYRLADAGHTWPGSLASLAVGAVFGLGVTNIDIAATELSWDFFSRHRLPS